MAATPLTYARFKAPDAPAGTLDVYEAGSLQNRKTTYSDPDLETENTNPIVLDSLGEADVFFTGLARCVLKKADGSQVWDKDKRGLAGDTSSEWINSLSATYSSSTQFTLSGDQTTEYHVGRRIRLTGSSTLYGNITVTSYSNPNTTVTVTTDSGSLDATLASVAVSINSAINPSVGYASVVHTFQNHGNAGATETIDLKVAIVHRIVLDQNCTLTFSSPPVTGLYGHFRLIVVQDGTGSRTITWPASVDWSSGVAPTLSTGANDIDVLDFFTVDGGTIWYGSVALSDAS